MYHVSRITFLKGVLFRVVSSLSLMSDVTKHTFCPPTDRCFFSKWLFLYYGGTTKNAFPQKVGCHARMHSWHEYSTCDSKLEETQVFAARAFLASPFCSWLIWRVRACFEWIFSCGVEQYEVAADPTFQDV